MIYRYGENGPEHFTRRNYLLSRGKVDRDHVHFNLTNDRIAQADLKITGIAVDDRAD